MLLMKRWIYHTHTSRLQSIRAEVNSLSGYNGNITMNLTHPQQNAGLESINFNFKRQKGDHHGVKGYLYTIAALHDRFTSSHQPRNLTLTSSANTSDAASGESRYMQQDKYIEQLVYYWKRQDEASTNIDATGRSVDNSRFYKHKLTSKDTFRVLTIMKGELEQDLHLRLKVRKLNEFNPRETSRDTYEAVSYNWGKHDTTVNIMLNDQSGFKISQQPEVRS
ncbi:hypothetical protein MRB53_041676 [Persea americana]|nr:hypothetical protein MRB53_041676 [Persea americana]